MLPRKHRISRKDFPASTNWGFRVFSPLFTMVAYDSFTKDSPSRIAVVVSKKTTKTAALRNRIRRRLYAVIELYLKKFLRPVTIVIYPKIEVTEAPFTLLKTELGQALKKARVM